MRAIKFRGKDVKTGEWVYGDLHTLCDKPHIHTEPTTYPFAGKRSFIDPDTIGQFTGLHDKNGKEVYEGDILKMSNCNFRGVVQWHNDGYFYINEYYPSVKVDDFSPIGRMLRYDMVVIDNIHDNPALIEKGGQDETIE